MLVPADAEFVVNIYLPEMNEVLADVGVSFKMQKELGLRLVAMLMKMFYALMWQEYVLPLPSMYLNLELQIGAAFVTTWNALTNFISGVPQTEDHLNVPENVYPGDEVCRDYSPHALWHELSAPGLLEITYITDYINHIFEMDLKVKMYEKMREEAILK